MYLLSPLDFSGVLRLLKNEVKQWELQVHHNLFAIGKLDLTVYYPAETICNVTSLPFSHPSLPSSPSLLPYPPPPLPSSTSLLPYPPPLPSSPSLLPYPPPLPSSPTLLPFPPPLPSSPTLLPLREVDQMR